MKLRLNQLGGQAGIGLAVIGFLLVFLGWNGAASVNFIERQFPYVISGGISGLCFVVLGAAMLVVQSQREDRAALLNSLAELREAVDRLAASSGAAMADGTASPALMAEAEAAGLVAAGPTSYHRPTCRLLEGRGVLPTMTVDDAKGRGLTPCRTCDPATVMLSEPQSSRRR